MDAVVIAGGIPKPEEPLYPFTLGQPKALVDIAGKPMVQWVLDALEEASQVDKVLIIGLREESGLTCSKVQAYFPSQGGMLENIVFGMEQVIAQKPATKHILLVSSDIPGIRPEIVDWVITNALQTDHDLYYHLITQEVMEKRYPKSKRTYTHLKDRVVCGGDMNIVATRTIHANRDKWERLIEARKSPLKQAAIFGWDTLLLLALKAITVDNVVKKITRRLGMTGRAVLCPYAEVGMDVDKPHQLELMRADLGK
jgi:GTP:adenosylcobinamide-phosphate guanylyltransferase